MKSELYLQNVRKLIRQRNTSLLFGVGMLVTNILLSTKLLGSSERTIIVPPEIRKEFWVEGAKASSSYLEQMSLYFTKQMLDMTPSNAAEIKPIILRHVSPAYYASLSQKLIEQEKYLKENSITTIFFPKSVRVDVENQLSEIKGQVKQMVGTDIVKEEEQTYRLKFEYGGAGFLISSFVRVQG